MRFNLKSQILLLLLFLGIAIKCLTPFLHAHVGNSADSGFHVNGLASLNSSQWADQQEDRTNSDSFAVTVGDARQHTVDIFYAAIVLVALFTVAIPCILSVCLKVVPRVLFIPSSFLNPKFPPPALAPPLCLIN